MSNPNILSERYASEYLNHLFSEENRIMLERAFWVFIMKSQKKLGLEIPDNVILAYETAIPKINLQRIKKIEKTTNHDVKAKIEAFVEAAGMQGSGEHIHRGMTSRDLTDNIEQAIYRQASIHIFQQYAGLLDKMISVGKQNSKIVIVARTHLQPAQPTLLGRRFSMWAEELHYHLNSFGEFIRNYPLRCIKGPVGTVSDMSNLLKMYPENDDYYSEKYVHPKLDELLRMELGFNEILISPGQVYPRSIDYDLVSKLVCLSSAPTNFATTMQLMAGMQLVTEGFSEGQTGSTAMPHKMNTPNCERIVSLSRLLKGYATAAAELVGTQWCEGDVSCSALRREVMPSAFYAVEGICITAQKVLKNMRTYPEMIKKELDYNAPFLATTGLLVMATNYGMGREKAHEIIKECALEEAEYLHTGKLPHKDFATRLAENQEFKKHNITKTSIQIEIAEAKKTTGLAAYQIDGVRNKVFDLAQNFREYLDE